MSEALPFASLCDAKGYHFCWGENGGRTAREDCYPLASLCDVKGYSFCYHIVMIGQSAILRDDLGVRLSKLCRGEEERRGRGENGGRAVRGLDG